MNSTTLRIDHPIIVVNLLTSAIDPLPFLSLCPQKETFYQESALRHFDLLFRTESKPSDVNVTRFETHCVRSGYYRGIKISRVLEESLLSVRCVST